jgi:hypothetical protein
VSRILAETGEDRRDREGEMEDPCNSTILIEKVSLKDRTVWDNYQTEAKHLKGKVLYSVKIDLTSRVQR